jgi:hypothetical protein
MPDVYTGTPRSSDGYNRDKDGYRIPTPGMPPIPVRNRKPMKQFVIEYVNQRRINVQLKPSLLIKDVKNVNRVFYINRPLMQKYGWEEDEWEHPKKRRRDQVISYIKDVCDNLRITRASLGIVTDNVGYLYYRGEQHTVGIDHLKELMRMGTDILIVEKQDVALSLRPLAAPYGIGILSTRGFLTENATDLAKLANGDGANIAILTDYDISGAVIAAKVPQIHRIGINDQTLKDLAINNIKSKLEENYIPNPRHLKHVIDNRFEFWGLDLGYLKEKRIEIDIVMEHVGNESFWKWVLKKLEKLFPNRNYNRAISLPDPYQFTPDELDGVYSRVRNHISDIMQPIIDEKKQELQNYAGLIENVNEYESDATDDIQDHLDRNLNLDFLNEDLQAIIDKWDRGEYFNGN